VSREHKDSDDFERVFFTRKEMGMNEALLSAAVSDLPMLEHLRQVFQRHRIQMGNRIAAVEGERSTMDISACAHYASVFEHLETEAAGKIAEVVTEHEMWPWLSAVKGIGTGLAGAMLAPIDIEKARHISSLWRYAGQGVKQDGSRDRLTAGERAPFNTGLKRTMYLVGASFLKSNSPYRRIYDEAKNDYIRDRQDWQKAHIDMAARRKMIKVFLSHLWMVWRFERGLSVELPLIVELEAHHHLIPPWDIVTNYTYPYELRQQLRERNEKVRELNEREIA